MRKIPRHMENPIDSFILHPCDKLIPFCLKYHITPNIITLSRIILIPFIWYLFFVGETVIQKQKFLLISFCLCLFFYFLDCLDGHLARSTGQCTALGDWLDHAADCVLFVVFIVYVMITSFPRKILILTICLLLPFIICVIHVKLQQQIYHKQHKRDKKENKNLCEYQDDEILTIVTSPLPDLNEEWIYWTRYFGLGTLFLLFLFFVYAVRLFKISESTKNE